MLDDFIDKIAASEEERSRLTTLGANTPLALLQLHKASSEAFENYLGKDRADAIVEQAAKYLSDSERVLLEQPVAVAGRLGARLGPRHSERNGEDC